MPHLLYDANTTAQWLAESAGGRPFLELAAGSIREPQYAVVTPAECVALIEDLGDDVS